MTSLIPANHSFSAFRSEPKFDRHDGGWTPISQLQRTDADVTIMLLAQNGISYSTPVRDPWFMAATPVLHGISSTQNLSLYIDSNPVHVLGCADQFQLCTQTHTKCTPVTNSDALYDAVINMGLNDVQLGIWSILYTSVLFQSTFYSVADRGGNALLASDTLSTGNQLQISLPDNQWMIEIANWFDISMARLQQQVVDFATGPLYTNKDLIFYPGPPNACGRQKINTTAGYLSFSVFGICIVFSIGGLLIFTSFLFDSVVGYFRKTFNWKDYKRLEWASDELLELERLAYSQRINTGSQTSEGNTGLPTNEGNADPQTSEGDAGLQANEENAFPANEGTDSPTSESNAGSISEGDAGPHTSEGNAGLEGNAVSSTSEGIAGSSISAGLQTSEENPDPQTNEGNADLEANEENASLPTHP